MLAFTLELMILLLIFRYILGYGFRVNRAALAVGIGIAAFYYVGHIFFSAELVYELYWVWQGIIVAVPVLLAQGKWATLLGVSLAIHSFFSVLGPFSLGIGLVATGGDGMNLDFTILHNLMLTVCIALLLICLIFMQKYKFRLKKQIEELNIFCFLAYFCFMQLLLRNDWYFGSVSDELAQITYGVNLIKNGIICVSVTFIFLSLLCLIIQRRALKKALVLNERCIKEQTEQYQLLSQRDQTLRKFRHDYNDHIHVMHALASAGKTEELFRYVKQLENIQDELRLIQTNHVICDALVNRYDSLCRQQKIELDITGKFPDHVDIPETGLCILLSNGLRNAYEAAVKCGEGGTITVELRHNDSFMFIRMTNPAKEKPNLKDGLFVTSKKNKDFHGYGVLNMIDAAEKAGGSVNWTYEETGYVITEIALPIINQA